VVQIKRELGHLAAMWDEIVRGYFRPSAPRASLALPVIGNDRVRQLANEQEKSPGMGG
jgi:hypothetical protein